ncbi:MAG: 6-bladed beta-propeller [Bacteroidales bacterium]|nr:6-bladed beta-propeller [Bacteroidales bacterium]
MKKQLLPLLIVPLLWNCQRDAQQESGILVAEYFVNDSLRLSEFIESESHFQLSLPEELPISAVRKVVPLDDRYLMQVQASRVTKLMIFSKTGVFIRAIGNNGSGPEEIGDMVSFLYNEQDNTIEVLDRGNNTIHIYDTTGLYIARGKPEVLPIDFMVSKEGSYIYYLPTGGKSETSDSILFPGIYLFDGDGRYIQQLARASFDNKFHVYGTPSFFGDKNNPFLITDYDDNLYQIDGDSVRIRYYIDFGEKKVPREVREGSFTNPATNTFDYVMIKGDPVSAGRYIQFQAAFIEVQKSGFALIDLKEETCKIYQKLYDDISGTSIKLIGGNGSNFYGMSRSIDQGPDPDEVIMIHILKAKR